MTGQADIDARWRVQALNPWRSRVVSVLKLVLPLTGLALLSSVFLLANPVDPERAIPLAEIDVADRARDPRLTAARFAGVTDDGVALRIETETARVNPMEPLDFRVTGLHVQLDSPEGGQVMLRADLGTVDRAAGVFSIDGSVDVIADPGYRLRTETVQGELDRVSVRMPHPVEGAAPAGEISAGSLTIEGAQNGVEGMRLVFSGGVRLIYQPQP